jgi:DNA-binding NarL/FixJ family response regulator
MTRERHSTSVKDPPVRGASGAATSSSPPLQPTGDGYERLTPREREVLKAIIRGSSNKEIGRLLDVSPRTIEVHRARIMTKLGAKNAADLVRIALSQDSH